jgi:phosphatidate cytidylyltransferase
MSEQPAKPRSNLTLRLLTAAVTVPLILYSLFLPPTWLFPALTLLVCGLGAYELFTIVAPAHPLLRVWGVGTCLLVCLVVSNTFGPAWGAPTFVLVTCGGLLLSLVQIEPMNQAASRAAWAVAGPAYLGGLFGVIDLLFRQQHGGEWVVLAMLFAFWSDTAGYFVGRSFGKHRLYPAVSPNKTIEGSLGGLLGALVGGLIAHFWFLPSLPLLDTLLLSPIAAGAGQLGDLCESLIKRSVGVKDSGTLLPGHGGILDRVDALLFTSAVVYLYVAWFYNPS